MSYEDIFVFGIVMLHREPLDSVPYKQAVGLLYLPDLC